MAGLLRRWFERLRVSASPPGTITAPPADPDLATTLERAGLSFDAWWTAARAPGRCLLYSDHASARAVIARLRENAPERCERAVERARRIVAHRFQLLGSAEYVPCDPDRPRGCSGLPHDYAPIDWALDPVSGLRFPRGVPHREWDLYAMRPGLADIKLPWELARCQHWPALAQAYLVSDDAVFAREVEHQLVDFETANPVGYGIHWTCTMDVALRAANWAIALRLLRDAPNEHLSAQFWARAFAALFAHGCFIRANLEDHYEVTSNHYLSNLLGLFFIGECFADLEAGRGWSEFARVGLEREIDVQVLADGADFESSVPYHRLVTELFLGGARLADVAGTPLSSHYRTRLASMLDYLAAVLRPDGKMPQLGDADDGRLHIFSDYGEWDPQDPRHIFGPAGATLGVDRWQEYGGPVRDWETTWWGFTDLAYHAPVRAASNEPQSLPASTRHFEHAGVAVFRDRGRYLAISNAKVGTNGFGNHKHNDLLSFELHLAGRALLVDPGSYVYTGDPPARNRFRSTAFHNTLRVDGAEQNELRPDWLFRLIEAAHPETLGFLVHSDFVEYLGRHRGYERLPSPVRHERALRFLRDPGALLILDRLVGGGEQQLAWHFHAAPGVEVLRTGDRHIALRIADVRVVLEHAPELRGEPEQSEYSPSYGLRVPSAAVDLVTRAPRASDTHWRFAIAEPEWLAREAALVEDHYAEMTAALIAAV